MKIQKVLKMLCTGIANETENCVAAGFPGGKTGGVAEKSRRVSGSFEIVEPET